MRFQISDGKLFDIPTEWWERTGMSDFVPQASSYTPESSGPFQVVPISDVAPIRRTPGLAGFSSDGFAEDRMRSIFGAFLHDTPLPPVEVHECSSGSFRYKLHHGFHRFYGSVAAGFSELPIVVVCDAKVFLEAEDAEAEGMKKPK
jgi:hypothetical protein